tara:strand:+ start:72 stop:545 length:474 start_codon:yes stop_codon:yes gene_type:complete
MDDRSRNSFRAYYTVWENTKHTELLKVPLDAFYVTANRINYTNTAIKMGLINLCTETYMEITELPPKALLQSCNVHIRFNATALDRFADIMQAEVNEIMWTDFDMRSNKLPTEEEIENAFHNIVQFEGPMGLTFFQGDMIREYEFDFDEDLKYTIPC